MKPTVAKLLEKLQAESRRKLAYEINEVKKLRTAQAILNAEPEVQAAVVRTMVQTVGRLGAVTPTFKPRWAEKKGLPWAGFQLLGALLRKQPPLAQPELTAMFDQLAGIGLLNSDQIRFAPLVSHVEELATREPLQPVLRKALANLANVLSGKKLPPVHAKVWERWEWGPSTADDKLAGRIERLLTGALRFKHQSAKSSAGPAAKTAMGTKKKKSSSNPVAAAPPPRVFLHPGEAWSDRAIADLKAASPDKQQAWLRLLAHCQGASGGTPGDKWLSTARDLMKGVGDRAFATQVLRWFPLVNQPRTQPIREWSHEYQPDPNQLIIEPHADILKGLAWCCGLMEDRDLARALTALALSAYRKIPLKGPREVKVGNACVTALGMMPGLEGVYQLALLKVRVKFGTAQKFVESALTAAAERSGLPRNALEEMAVPAYGLTDVGRRVEKIGGYTAELTVTGTDSTAITWLKPDGKRQTSVPAAVKEKFGEDLKELQSAAKDIQRMLPAQRERIDNLFRDQKSRPFEVWRERYLDHPLVGVLARRLIWEFTSGQKTTAGIFFNGALADLDLKHLPNLGANTAVQLWHPIGKDPNEIVAWRAWLDAQQIQQPFKQAHREVYLLTDAERETHTYSNRFAAHILRQHQFNALCAARGWKNKLRLLVDAEFPPATVYLPKWNLRAEFWIEGVGEDYGTDTNDAGVFLRLSTDQVRFYRLEAAQRSAHAGGGGYHAGHGEPDAEPLPLEEIPALVFSEVMRDVDLFVGVASVGNDPTWSDGGPEGRYRDYWQSYSFGELNATAKTRKEVLEGLVPRLKIAGQCSLLEKFLVVKGALRTYKIHLGSGNILMEPNDRYLCIVPRQSDTDTSGVLLPFEGDRTLSIILSKAFLLAEDNKIKDETITRQIRSA